MDDAGKLALVTGANRGLGGAIAEGLASRGVQVLVGCRNPAALDEMTDYRLEPLALEVNSESSVEQAQRYILETYGRLDMLVNNAGLFLDFDTSLSLRERFQQMFEVNVFGATLVTDTMLPLLQCAERARVVNVSSGLGSFGLRTDPAWPYASMAVPFYAASKAALNAMTVSQARALGEYGISVNSICPGLTATAATGYQGRSVEESAAIVVSTLMAEETFTGAFINDEGVMPW